MKHLSTFSTHGAIAANAQLLRHVGIPVVPIDEFQGGSVVSHFPGDRLAGIIRIVDEEQNGSADRAGARAGNVVVEGGISPTKQQFGMKQRALQVGHGVHPGTIQVLNPQTTATGCAPSQFFRDATIGANTHRLMTVVVIHIGIAVYPVQLPLFGLGVSLLGCQLSPVLSCLSDEFERQECLSLPPFPLKSQNVQSLKLLAEARS